MAAGSKIPRSRAVWSSKTSRDSGARSSLIQRSTGRPKPLLAPRQDLLREERLGDFPEDELRREPAELHRARHGRGERHQLLVDERTSHLQRVRHRSDVDLCENVVGEVGLNVEVEEAVDRVRGRRCGVELAKAARDEVLGEALAHGRPVESDAVFMRDVRRQTEEAHVLRLHQPAPVVAHLLCGRDRDAAKRLRERAGQWPGESLVARAPFASASSGGSRQTLRRHRRRSAPR